MTLLELAKIYTELVELDDAISTSDSEAKNRAGQLRSQYHDLLLARMKEEGIDFEDRFDAAQKAFDLVRKAI